MGDIAEMIINGILCEQCGVFIDFEEIGYPRLCNSCNCCSIEENIKASNDD